MGSLSEEEKKERANKIQKAENIYVILSDATRMPFVECDEETYDDQIILFTDEKEAMKEAASIVAAGDAVSVRKMPQRFFLPFYTSLFSMGVNRVWIDRGMDDGFAIELQDVVQRTKEEDLPKDKPRIENPELHLTALYLVQMVRGRKEHVKQAEKELETEMLAHYADAKLIMPIMNDKEIITLTLPNGQNFLPAFTDVQEYLKFCNANKDKQMKTVVIDTKKLQEVMPATISGININPQGVNLQLSIKKKTNPTQNA